MSPVVTRGLAQRNILEDPEQMRTLAEQAAEELADAPAEEVIRWAVDTFGERICVTSSMTDAVIIHLAAAVQPGIDVVFLDTGYHFAETIGTRDAVEAVYPVKLLNITPSRTVKEQDAALGPRPQSITRPMNGNRRSRSNERGREPAAVMAYPELLTRGGRTEKASHLQLGLANPISAPAPAPLARSWAPQIGAVLEPP